MKVSPSAQEPRARIQPDGALRRALRVLVLGITLLFVAALAISSALVVYTAWIHDLRNGLFALLFAILSAQIALNWMLWRDDEE
jgi:urea transporter